jgi:2Fe-2S ferredoxin
MITIHVQDTNGEKRSVEFKENPSGNLMEVLVEEIFDVPAICGGIAGCGTCHISIQTQGETLPAPGDDEQFMLDTLGNKEGNSRLSCQLKLTKQLDGSEIKILGDG